MVMYPWKQPRLNDGYYDRNSSHQFKNTDRHVTKGVSSYGGEKGRNDRQRSSPDYRHSRDPSPSRPIRYSNKLSYIDRNKERYDKGSRISPSGYRSSKNDINSSKNGDKSAHDGDCYRDNSVRDSSNGSQSREKEQEQRNEVQKTALRVCGDWSEHISGSGKRYYYNCKTEVSKWEKPKEWTLDTPSKSRKDRDRDRHSNSSSSGGARHSSRRHSDKRQRSRESSPSRRDSRQGDRRDRHKSHDAAPVDTQKLSQTALKPVTNYNSISQERRNDALWNADRYTRSTSDAKDENSRENENRDIRGSVDMDISPDSTPPLQDTAPPTSVQLSNTVSSSVTNYPSHVAVSTATSLASLPGNSAGVTLGNLSSVLTRLGDQSLLQNIDSKKLQEQALQTLQQLQQAISSRKVSIQNAGSAQSPRVSCANQSQSATPLTHQQSPYSQSSPQHDSGSQKGNTTPLTSERPYVAPAQGQTTPQRAVSTPTSAGHTYRSQQSVDDEPPGHSSPASEHSARSSRPDRSSPTPSQNSSQGVVSTSLGAVSQKQPCIQLPPSLANYYREELTSHVMGWQMNHAEKQANRYRVDAHSVGSRLSTQLSVDLKRARSEVRAGEINTTLQEQRILFIRQQILDLERGTKN